MSHLYNKCTSPLYKIIFRFALIRVITLENNRCVVKSVTDDIISINFLPNPVFVPIYNFIISRLIPTDAIWTVAYIDNKKICDKILHAMSPLD